MASIELLDEETLNVTLSDDIGLESNINEPESINVEQLPNDYTPSYTESDPIFVSSPAASIKEDDITNWNSKSDFDGDYESLTNKPTIPTVPTNLSSFTDDLGSSPTHTHSQYLTEHQDISGKVDKETGKGLSSNDFTDTYKSNVDSNTTAKHTHSNKSVLDDISSSDVSSWDSKQEALVSGTNIKTINNQSLLGSGNITIEGGGGTATDVQINGTSITSNDVANIVTEGTYNASTNKIATKSDIPTKTSDLTNDSGFITSYTETDPVFTSSVAHGITSTDITNWNNKSTFSGSYNDLTNKPTIPDELSDLSDDSTHRLVTDTEKSTWNAKSDFSGSYTDLTDKPTIPTKTSDITNDSGFITSFGNAKTYYGTSSTSASTAAKVATCSGFTLETGATIFIKFTNGNSYNGTATLNVNSTGAKTICSVGTTETTRYYWKSGEVVGFVYDGTNYTLIEKAPATTTYYGITKLSSSTSSTSEALAATPKAVKTVADSIPTKTSDLTNDSGFITNSYHDSSKQDSLVSGTNIKTINNTSLLGSGDISFETIQEISGESSIRISNLDAGIYKIYGGTQSCAVYYNSNDSLFVGSFSCAYLIVTNYDDIYTNKNWVFIGNGYPDFCCGYSWNSNGYCYNVTSAEAQEAITGILSNLTTTAKTNLVSAINELDSDKQETLVSGTNIKTINGNSILGSGNLTINASAEVNNLLVALGLDTDTYSTSTTYAVGDTVVHNNTVYECNTANTTGTWDSTKWDLVPIIVND